MKSASADWPGQRRRHDATGLARPRGGGWRVGPQKQHPVGSVRLLSLAVVKQINHQRHEPHQG